jgi:hypothetical protein
VAFAGKIGMNLDVCHSDNIVRWHAMELGWSSRDKLPKRLVIQNRHTRVSCKGP